MSSKASSLYDAMGWPLVTSPRLLAQEGPRNSLSHVRRQWAVKSQEIQLEAAIILPYSCCRQSRSRFAFGLRSRSGGSQRYVARGLPTRLSAIPYAGPTEARSGSVSQRAATPDSRKRAMRPSPRPATAPEMAGRTDPVTHCRGFGAKWRARP